jgi:hypothetical protein
MSIGASRKVSDERARAILAYALEQRERGRLFVHDLLASELEALAQEVLDKRTACGILNARIDELENQVDVAAKLLAKHAGDPRALRVVPKSSPENDRDDAGKNVHAPGASRK